jgi:hypothetical protein
MRRMNEENRESGTVPMRQVIRYNVGLDGDDGGEAAQHWAQRVQDLAASLQPARAAVPSPPGPVPSRALFVWRAETVRAGPFFYFRAACCASCACLFAAVPLHARRHVAEGA